MPELAQDQSLRMACAMVKGTHEVPVMSQTREEDITARWMEVREGSRRSSKVVKLLF